MDAPHTDATLDPHEVLGVPLDATVEDIEAAYRRQARRWHPDVNSGQDSGDHMRRINAARDLLCGRVRPGPEVPAAPPCPGVEPAAVDFGPVGPTCRHATVTVRLRNTGGPPTTVRVEPEEGVFWSVREVRGGISDGEVAQFDLGVHHGGLSTGVHVDSVRLFLDDIPAEVELSARIERHGNAAVTLWTSAVAGIAGATAIVIPSADPGTLTLTAAGVVILAFLCGGALTGRRKQWPENWSDWWPAVVWFDAYSRAPHTLRHHLRWPTEVLPASRRWTSARVDEYAALAGVGPVRTTFTQGAFRAATGHRPITATQASVRSGRFLYIPWALRLTRGAAERVVAHQVAHLIFPESEHDARFFERVQAMIDATSCAACKQGFTQEPR